MGLSKLSSVTLLICAAVIVSACSMIEGDVEENVEDIQSGGNITDNDFGVDEMFVGNDAPEIQAPTLPK